MSDPISDLLTRVRNAIGARQTKVDVPASRLKIEIARILKEEGYITNYSLKTTEGSNAQNFAHLPAVWSERRERDFTHPACFEAKPPRVCREHRDSRVLGGLGINILSTSHGVMTGKAARRAHVGGEVLCSVY